MLNTQPYSLRVKKDWRHVPPAPAAQELPPVQGVCCFPGRLLESSPAGLRNKPRELRVLHSALGAK